MCWKNMTKSKIWETKKQKSERLKEFIECFSLFIRECYCIVRSVEKNAESKNPKVLTTKNGRIIAL